MDLDLNPTEDLALKGRNAPKFKPKSKTQVKVAPGLTSTLIATECDKEIDDTILTSRVGTESVAIPVNNGDTEFERTGGSTFEALETVNNGVNNKEYEDNDSSHGFEVIGDLSDILLEDPSTALNKESANLDDSEIIVSDANCYSKIDNGNSSPMADSEIDLVTCSIPDTDHLEDTFPSDDAVDFSFVDFSDFAGPDLTKEDEYIHELRSECATENNGKPNFEGTQVDLRGHLNKCSTTSQTDHILNVEEYSEQECFGTPEENSDIPFVAKMPLKRRREAKKSQQSVNENTKKEAPKSGKKFSHSSSRKKERVKELLSIPNDKLDLLRLPVVDILLLQDYREKSTSRSSDDKNSSTSSNPLFNSRSFSSRDPTVRWSPQDTELFYEAIRQFGSNMSMIQQLFPGRTRDQIKRKYRKEGKQNPSRISEALSGVSHDHSYFTKVIDQLRKSSDHPKRNSTVDDHEEKEAILDPDFKGKSTSTPDEENFSEEEIVMEEEDISASNEWTYTSQL